MTVVAAYAVDGAVHMAADSMNNVYDRPVPGGAVKIVRCDVGSEPMLIGVCGDGCLASLALRRLDVPPVNGDEDDWAFEVATALTTLAVEHGVTNDGRIDGTLLLGWRGRVWTLTHHQAIPHPDGIAAVGSGEGPAIGVLDALTECGVDPRSAVETAVAVAIRRDRYCGGPIQYERLGT